MANYTTYVADLINYAVETTPPSANFSAAIPSFIAYAEGRLYRELDLLSAVIRDSSATTTPNSRNFTLPQSIGYFITTQQMNLITPAGQGVTGGIRNPLLPVSKDFMDYAWPSETSPSGNPIPQYYAPVSDQSFILGPAPGAAYTIEVVGTIHPAPLSASNPTTFLTTVLYDLFLAASMIEVAAWQLNFGQQSDNPQLAQSWESEYGKLFPSAKLEELRKRYSAASWSSYESSNAAVPQRG